MRRNTYSLKEMLDLYRSIKEKRRILHIHELDFFSQDLTDFIKNLVEEFIMEAQETIAQVHMDCDEEHCEHILNDNVWCNMLDCIDEEYSDRGIEHEYWKCNVCLEFLDKVENELIRYINVEAPASVSYSRGSGSLLVALHNYEDTEFFLSYNP